MQGSDATEEISDDISEESSDKTAEESSNDAYEESSDEATEGSSGDAYEESSHKTDEERSDEAYEESSDEATEMSSDDSDEESSNDNDVHVIEERNEGAARTGSFFAAMGFGLAYYGALLGGFSIGLAIYKGAPLGFRAVALLGTVLFCSAGTGVQYILAASEGFRYPLYAGIGASITGFGTTLSGFSTLLAYFGLAVIGGDFGAALAGSGVTFAYLAFFITCLGAFLTTYSINPDVFMGELEEFRKALELSDAWMNEKIHSLFFAYY